MTSLCIMESQKITVGKTSEHGFSIGFLWHFSNDFPIGFQCIVNDYQYKEIIGSSDMFGLSPSCCHETYCMSETSNTYWFANHRSTHGKKKICCFGVKLIVLFLSHSCIRFSQKQVNLIIKDLNTKILKSNKILSPKFVSGLNKFDKFKKF